MIGDRAMISPLDQPRSVQMLLRSGEVDIQKLKGDNNSILGQLWEQDDDPKLS